MSNTIVDSAPAADDGAGRKINESQKTFTKNQKAFAE